MFELKFFFALIIISLATWRLTGILSTPEKIAERLHVWVGGKLDAALPGQFTYPDTLLAYLVSCFKCTSVWVGAFFVLMWLICPYVVLAFAASGVAILIEEQRYG